MLGLEYHITKTVFFLTEKIKLDLVALVILLEVES